MQAGYPYTDDMNGYQNEGFGPMDMTIKHGLRWSAARYGTVRSAPFFCVLILPCFASNVVGGGGRSALCAYKNPPISNCHFSPPNYCLPSAYLRPAMKRPHVKVLTSQLANRVLFEGSRAVGVETLKVIPWSLC